MAGPWEKYQTDSGPWEKFSTVVEVPKPEQSFFDGVKQSAGNVGAGLVRGAGSIGATLLSPFETSQENADRRKAIDDVMRSTGVDTESIGFQGGKLTSEIAGTAGAGGLFGKALTKAAPTLIANSPRLAQLLEATKTGGFSLGTPAATTLAGKAADLGIRTAGGAISGGAMSGMVNPEDATTGALIGGVLPGAVQIAGKAAGQVGRAVNFVKKPQEQHIANKLAQAVGVTPKELVTALSQQGPNLLPGYQATVPQILQNPVASQLQRTLKTAGANALGDAERVQQSVYRNALERVAPIDVSVQDAANRAGGAIQSYAIPARSSATDRVRNAFDSVDPFGDSALNLPIDEMRQAKGKFLGEGTFGTGGKASEAISTAERVGTMELPSIESLGREVANKSQTLEQAVRSAGGLRGKTGELRDLGIKQSGTTGLINNKSGKSADLLAQDMFERGYIADADPDTLIQALRNGGGRKIFATDQVESNGFQRMAESAMGDAPLAEIISKPVPFQTVQNLRSSIGEAAQQAEAKGANKESAALKQMIAEIDSRINRAAGGNVGADEFFPKEMADRYRKALKLHADKMGKFETGPQRGMFRLGGDGQASVQGAEIPGKFYSGRRSQVEDLNSFKRLIGDSPALLDELKRYAVTEGANTANAAGDLTSKYGKWLQSRTGANTALFTPQEKATLDQVGKAVKRGLDAEGLGRVSGSDTAQKLEALNNLGLLDSKIVNVLATKIPVVGSFTGPALTALKETAGQTRNKVLSGLLANPDDLVKALNPRTVQSNALLDWMNKNGAYASRVIPQMAVSGP